MLNESWLYTLLSLGIVILIITFHRRISAKYHQWKSFSIIESEEPDYNSGDNRIIDGTRTREKTGFKVTQNHPHKNH